MASKTIRQLANEMGADVAELLKLFGKSSGSDLVSEKEIEKVRQSRQGSARPPQPQTEKNPIGNAMFVEVGQKVDQQLNPVALRMRLYAQQSLENKLAENICTLSSEEAIALLSQYGDDLGVQDNFDFFDQTAGHMDLSSCVQAIAAPQTEASKQLPFGCAQGTTGAAANPDSSTKSEAISTAPSKEPADSMPPRSGKASEKS